MSASGASWSENSAVLAVNDVQYAYPRTTALRGVSPTAASSWSRTTTGWPRPPTVRCA